MGIDCAKFSGLQYSVDLHIRLTHFNQHLHLIIEPSNDCWRSMFSICWPEKCGSKLRATSGSNLDAIQQPSH